MTQPAGAEVRIKLVADDQTSETVEKVRAGVQHVGEEAHKAAGAAGGGGGSGTLAGGMAMVSGAAVAGVAAVGLLTVGLHEGYEAAKILGEAAVGAASEYNKQIKAMSGVLMLIDAGAHSMKDIRAYAADVHEELEGTGLAMGIASDKMDDAFNTLMERGGLASEKAKELTGDMALVGKVVRGGMDGLASGFSMIEMGVVRARNPIVQLIAATHTLEGNAHAVAAQMQKMTPEKQMEMAEKAIAKQAELMRSSGGGAPQLGLEGLKTSMSGVREMFLVSMGKPMLDALLPPLNRVQQFLLAHVEKIQEWGTKIGDQFARVINMVVAASSGIYDGIVLSWDRIQTSFDEIFGDWVKAWDAASSDTASIQKSFASFTEDLVLAFELGAKIMKATAEVFMDAKDALTPGRAVGQTKADVAAAAMHSAAGGGTQAEFDKAADNYRRLALEVNGITAEMADKWIGQERAKHEAAMSGGDAALQAANSGHYDQMSAYLQKAVDENNEGAEKFALSMIRESENAKQALVDGGIKIAGGMQKMMSIVSNLDPELAKQIKKMQNPLGKDGKGISAPHTTNVNISGGIQIKQDFRDQDPDRIALVFRDDVARKALARTSARTSSLFGL